MTAVTGTDPAPPGSDQAPLALEVDHVSASYGPYRALFDVSFTVPSGGVTALIGSNGAGKSTVSRVVTGLLDVYKRQGKNSSKNPVPVTPPVGTPGT